jgi:hypothetical protein
MIAIKLAADSGKRCSSWRQAGPPASALVSAMCDDY